MLLDTSGLFACHHTNEVQHPIAVGLFNTVPRLLTHSYVLDEFIALANARRLARPPVLAFSQSLLNHPNVEIVWVEAGLHTKALDLLTRRPDKTYSLCDAVSFVLMRERGVSEALTTDHHFVQEGFTRLLTP